MKMGQGGICGCSFLSRVFLHLSQPVVALLELFIFVLERGDLIEELLAYLIKTKLLVRSLVYIHDLR